MMQMQHDAPFSFSAVPASWALFILVSRTAANDHAAADSDGVTKSVGVHYKRYRRTYESSTISPRSSMMESEGKKKNSGRRKETSEAPTTQTYFWMNLFLDAIRCWLSKHRDVPNRSPSQSRKEGEMGAWRQIGPICQPRSTGAA